LKLHDASVNTSSAGNATLQGTFGGVPSIIWRTNFSGATASIGRDKDFNGIECDPNTAVTVNWAATNIACCMGYEIVPA
jgi:hypothetical protein